jgi:photosystem II stability/assembly factor-like uncharacterized protein
MSARAEKLEGEPDLVSVDVGKGYAFAVGKAGEIWSMQIKRGLWGKERKTTQTELRDVHVVSGKDVWVVGIGGMFLHYDGDEWVSPAGSTSRSFHGVAFADRRRGIAVGDSGRVYQYVKDGWQNFHAMTRKPSLRAVVRVGRGRRERFVAVGNKGEAVAFTGVGASLGADPEVTGTETDLGAIGACRGSKAEAVAVGAVAMLREKAGAWRKLPDPPEALTGVALRCKRGSVTQVFATAGRGLAVYDVASKAWSTRAVEGAGQLNDIAWADKKQLLVVGNGGFWSVLPADPPATD